MKPKLYLVLAGLFLLSGQLKAQAPNLFNYQGVARDALGNQLPNQKIGLRFTIHQASDLGTTVYSEEDTVTTNQFGLFTVSIGSGTVTSGNMATISWGTNSYYLEIEMDPTGGTNYTDLGAQQLLSVPYALYSQSSGSSSSSAKFVASTGIAISDSLIGAQVDSALWNANKLQGDSVSISSPAVGQVLQWTGTAWTPITQTVLTNATLTGNGTTASVLGLAQNGAVNGQVLEWNGTTWAPATPSVGSNGWTLSGNAGTSYISNPTATGGNFIGTTDDEGLQFRVNGNIAGLIEDFSSSEGDAAFGYEALYNNYENGGSQSEAFGYQALYNNGGTQNDAFGYQALYNNTYATQDVGIGYQALYNNDNDQQGLANDNTAVGALSLYNNIDNANNVAIGYQALYSDDLDDNNSANYNTAVGVLALSNDVDGSSNTAVGFNANFSASDQGNSINNSTAIGANAIVNTSNTVQLGRFANVQFDQALMPGGNAGTVGQVLQSNGAGVVPTWVNPATGTVTGVTATSPLASSGGVAPTISLTGIVPIANGGTNSGAALAGSGIMISNGTQIVQGAAGSATTVLHGNALGAPTYGAVDLTTDITGTLPVANGGTGLTAVGANGTVLTITGGVPTWVTPSGTGTVTGVGSGFGLQGGTITTTGTLSIDTLRGASVGMPTIYFVDSSISSATAELAQPNQQLVYGTGSGVTSSANVIYNGSQLYLDLADGWGGLHVEGISGGEASIALNPDNIGNGNAGMWVLATNGSNMNNTADWALYNAGNVNQPIYITQSTNAVTFDRAYTFPTTDGSNGQVLTTDGSGNVTWEVPGSNGGDSAALTYQEIGYGDANNIMTSNSNLIYDAFSNVQLHGGNFALDNAHAIMFNGVNDVNWMILRTTGDGKFVTGNSLTFQHSNGPGEGMIIQDNNGNVDMEILGSTRAITFDEAYTFPISDGTSGQVFSTDGAGNVTWTTPATPTPAWDLTGNAGTTYGTNFIGTTDDQGLQFEINNSEAGRIEDITSGKGSTAFGYQSMLTESSSSIYGTGFGFRALNIDSGTANVGVGSYALRTVSGSYNTAIGSGSQSSRVDADVTGSNNTGLGSYTLWSLYNGNNNTASGYLSEKRLTSGNDNAAYGVSALGNSNGSFNTAIGDSSLVSDKTGTYNTALGYDADVAIDGLTNSTVIGYDATVGTSNTIVLGNNNVTALDINGALSPWNGATYNSGTLGQVLQSNGAGVAPTWVTPSNATSVAWSLTGNSGTTYGTNYIGTSDNTNLMFKINHSEAGLIENATTANTALGYNSLFELGSGTQNTGVGVYSLYSDVDGSDNTALGYEAGFNAPDNGNPSGNITLIGANAFLNNMSGAINNATIIGASAEGDSSNSIVLGNHLVTQTDFNGALGVWNGSNYNEGAAGQILQSNGLDVAPTWVTPSANDWSLNGNSGTTYGSNFMGTTDDEGIMFEVDGTIAGRIEDGNLGAGSNWNTAIGYIALATNSGANNEAFGGGALNYNTGSDNVAVGNVALGTNSGNYNIAIGADAMNNNQGTGNTAVGYSALNTNVTGNQITALGYGANVGVDGLSNATAIGAGAVVDSSNNVVLGNNSVTQTDFNGALGVWNGSNYNQGVAGQVLQSNGADVAPTWVTPGAGGGWALTGNSGTTYSTNFIGTTDDQGIQLRVNNVVAGLVEDANNANGSYSNTGLGYQALSNNNSDAAGVAQENTAIGFHAMLSNVDGALNTAVGTGALHSNVEAGSNVALGYNALHENDNSAMGTANENVAVGSEALQYNVNAANNVAIGFNALVDNDIDGAEMANFNVGIGSQALGNVVDGAGNTVVGAKTNLSASDEGNPSSNNTAVGSYSTINNSNGAITNSTALGFQVTVDSSNSVVLGNNGVTQIDFSGALGIWNGTNYNQGATGQVLQSNGADVAPTWVTPGAGNAWSLTGNSGTTYGTNYIGTSDNTNLMFDIDGQEAGRIESNSTANTALGYATLLSISSGGLNTAMGNSALQSLQTGSNDNAFGVNAMTNMESGSNDDALGTWAMAGLSSGSQNVGIGYAVLELNSTGSNNVSVGYESMFGLSGSQNTALGSYAMRATNSGNQNTAIGDSALYDTQGGSTLTALGYNATVGASNLSDATAIGSNAVVDSSFNIVLGDNNVTQTDFNGALGVWTGSNYNEGAAGQVLQSNGADVAPTWVTPTGGAASLASAQIGYGSGANTLTGDGNFTRSDEGILLSDGYDNLFIGGNGEAGNDYTLQNSGAGGIENIGLGTGTLDNLNEGNNNIAIGAGSSNGDYDGNNNVSLGFNALATNNNGSNLIAIGYKANVSVDGFNNSIALGDSAIISSSNQFVVNPNITNWNIGGVSYAIPSSQGASNTVLTNDGSGNLSWTTPSTGVAEFVQTTQIPNNSVPPGTAFTIGTQVVNTSPSNIITLSGDGGTVFELAPGIYSIDYEMSLNAAGSIALYTGASPFALAADNNTITGSSTATTWIHGRAFETVTTAPYFFGVSPVVGTASVSTAGTAAGQYIVRVTITKLQ